MNKECFRKTYASVAPVLFKRDSDITKQCMREIERSIVGQSVLDVGCGNGLLARMLSRTHAVTALDVNIGFSLRVTSPNICFIEGDAQKLPFADRQFDTVVCAHTLEHVQDIYGTIHQLRRVTKQRLIVVVPKQRPYRYTFDLHVHFFPYIHSLLMVMKKNHWVYSCKEINGDLLYIEDMRDSYGTR